MIYFFSDQNSYSFVVRVLEIIAPLTGTPYWALISVICWQSFFLVFVKSNVASVTLSATVPDMPNGRYFILSWTWMLNKTVQRNLEVQVLHWVVERLLTCLAFSSWLFMIKWICMSLEIWFIIKLYRHSDEMFVCSELLLFACIKQKRWVIYDSSRPFIVSK